MDLENFVASSLAQIARAIKQAQEDAASTGAWINPAGAGLPGRDSIPVEIEAGIFAWVHNVEFDVALTVNDTQEANAGAKVQIFAASLGGGGAVKYENNAVSRVKFSVPVVWPPTRREEREHALDAQKRALRRSIERPFT